LYELFSFSFQREKKDKEKSSSFIKRFTGSGKSKLMKGKTPPPPPPPAKVFHPLGPQSSADGFSHSKSVSLTAEESGAAVPPPPPVAHKKSSSVDATSSQHVPKKPKPLPKERYVYVILHLFIERYTVLQLDAIVAQ
jgi:hypothetical protein